MRQEEGEGPEWLLFAGPLLSRLSCGGLGRGHRQPPRARGQAGLLGSAEALGHRAPGTGHRLFYDALSRLVPPLLGIYVKSARVCLNLLPLMLLLFLFAVQVPRQITYDLAASCPFTRGTAACVVGARPGCSSGAAGVREPGRLGRAALLEGAVLGRTCRRRGRPSNPGA